MPPKTQYAQSRGTRIAYQVVGEGPLDLVFVPGVLSHLELQWADPAYARFLGRLASFARLIIFDKRGTGMSDPAREPPSLEQRVDDLRAVMNAAASERAVILGFSDGGPNAAVFAATYPERTAALILCSTWARGLAHSTDEGGLGPEVEARAMPVLDHWGEGRGLEIFAPTLAGSSLNRRNYALFERAGASVEMMRLLIEATRNLDISHVLPSIAVPTLVLHRADDYIPISAGRWMAERIPGARFVELQGSDHVPFAGDSNSLLTAIEDFLEGMTGSQRADRLMATVLFTDIVGSTDRLVKQGDRRWRETLETHDAISRGEVERHGGKLLESTGDGILATFDGPARGVHCAWALTDQVRRAGLEIRAGLHTGECQLKANGIAGLAVHAAARVMAQADAGEVLVSQAVRDLVIGSGVEFVPRGSKPLKGLPGDWPLFELPASRHPCPRSSWMQHQQPPATS